MLTSDYLKPRDDLVVSIQGGFGCIKGEWSRQSLHKRATEIVPVADHSKQQIKSLRSS